MLFMPVKFLENLLAKFFAYFVCYPTVQVTYVGALSQSFSM